MDGLNRHDKVIITGDMKANFGGDNEDMVVWKVGDGDGKVWIKSKKQQRVKAL